jgi:transcriptional antiterminator RfaH
MMGAESLDMRVCDGVTVTAIAPGALHPECASHEAPQQEISSKSGHGGPRANAGGARANSGGSRVNAGRPAKAKPPISDPMPKHQGLRWYCLQTAPRGELLAVLHLTHRGFPTFLPLHQPDRHQVLRPLFPGWLFVQFDQSKGLYGSIMQAPGVRDLHAASPLDAGFVVELIRLYGPGGSAVLPERAQTLEPMERGQLVRVVDGAMMDLVGVCQWSDRQKVELLAEIMGRRVRVSLPLKSVERA